MTNVIKESEQSNLEISREDVKILIDIVDTQIRWMEFVKQILKKTDRINTYLANQNKNDLNKLRDELWEKI